MAKSKNIFFCQECGYESAKWLGQCPACKAWNAFVEEPTIEREVRLQRQASGQSFRTGATVIGSFK